MRSRHLPLPPGRSLQRVRQRLRAVLDAGRRRHLADVRFYQLLSEADRLRAGNRAPADARVRRLVPPL